jgi:hypothetical protein
MNVKLPRAQLFKSGTGVHHGLAGSIHGFSVKPAVTGVTKIKKTGYADEI